MFFKSISAFLAVAIAYFIYENGYNTREAAYFVMMPIATLLCYLLLGVAD